MAPTPRARPPAPGRRPPSRAPAYPQTGRPGPPSGAPRPVARNGQRRPGARPRRRRSGVGSRTVVLVTLAAVTLGAAGWFLFLRGGGEASPEFVRAESTFVSAAREIPTAAAQVQQQADMGVFDLLATSALMRMREQLEVFRRLARDEEGAGARIADDAANSASLGINAGGIFRDALLRNRVADAHGAQSQLESSIDDLEAQAQKWKKL